MWKFLVRRLLLGLLIVILGAFVVYAVIRCLPSSYTEKMAQNLADNSHGTLTYEEMIQQLNDQYGLGEDNGILSGFLSWLGKAIKLEFGDSWVNMRPVTKVFSESIWYSVLMNVIALLVQVFVSVPLGIIAARKQYRAPDYIVTVFALACISLPSFYIGTLLKYIFAMKLEWLPLYGIIGNNHANLSALGKIWDYAVHLIMPVFTLALLSIGTLMRYTRTNMLEVLNADYIRTARAKGLSEKAVINHHAFRNTMIPLITAFSGLLPAFFGGQMIIESIFKIPGIGGVAYNAVQQGDIPFAMFYTTFIIVLTQVSHILADIMYAVVDPRVRIN